MSRVCMDLGATNIKSALIENGCLLRSDATKTHADLGFSAILSALSAAIESHLFSEEAKASPVTGIAVSSAGTIDAQSKICTYATPNLPGFTGFRIGEYIEKKYALPVSVLNDGHAALLGEIAVDASLKSKRVLMLTLGSGVGGAFAKEGKIIAEERNDYCRYGHFVMIPDGISCNCGKRGCIEQYLSGRAINRLASEYGIGADRIFAEYGKGDARAADAIGKLRAYLKTALETIAQTDFFDVCVLGGGAADGTGELFTKITGGLGFEIRRARAGNTAGMLGADVFFEQFYGNA